jgi:hypothetical protein
VRDGDGTALTHPDVIKARKDGLFYLADFKDLPQGGMVRRLTRISAEFKF